jgi:hypothetical protein
MPKNCIPTIFRHSLHSKMSSISTPPSSLLMRETAWLCGSTIGAMSSHREVNTRSLWGKLKINCLQWKGRAHSKYSLESKVSSLLSRCHATELIVEGHPLSHLAACVPPAPPPGIDRPPYLDPGVSRGPRGFHGGTKVEPVFYYMPLANTIRSPMPQDPNGHVQDRNHDHGGAPYNGYRRDPNSALWPYRMNRIEEHPSDNRANSRFGPIGENYQYGKKYRSTQDGANGHQGRKGYEAYNASSFEYRGNRSYRVSR